MRILRGVLLFTALAIGCSDDSAAPPIVEATITGTYTLQTFNGQPPPGVVQDDQNGRLELLSSILTMNADGSFQERDRFRFTLGTNTATEDFTVTGTWTRNGDNITLTATNQGVTQIIGGVWNGSDQLTFTNAGKVYVYRKSSSS